MKQNNPPDPLLDASICRPKPTYGNFWNSSGMLPTIDNHDILCHRFQSSQANAQPMLMPESGVCVVDLDRGTITVLPSIRLVTNNPLPSMESRVFPGQNLYSQSICGNRAEMPSCSLANHASNLMSESSAFSRISKSEEYSSNPNSSKSLTRDRENWKDLQSEKKHELGNIASENISFTLAARETQLLNWNSLHVDRFNETTPRVSPIRSLSAAPIAWTAQPFLQQRLSTATLTDNGHGNKRPYPHVSTLDPPPKMKRMMLHAGASHGGRDVEERHVNVATVTGIRPIECVQATLELMQHAAEGINNTEQAPVAPSMLTHIMDRRHERYVSRALRQHQDVDQSTRNPGVNVRNDTIEDSFLQLYFLDVEKRRSKLKIEMEDWFSALTRGLGLHQQRIPTLDGARVFHIKNKGGRPLKRFRGRNAHQNNAQRRVASKVRKEAIEIKRRQLPNLCRAMENVRLVGDVVIHPPNPATIVSMNGLELSIEAVCGVAETLGNLISYFDEKESEKAVKKHIPNTSHKGWQFRD